MAICKSCKAANPSERDLWVCFCDEHVCDRCYVEHTDKKHFAELYPEIHKKRQERCREPNPTAPQDTSLACDQSWGHQKAHVCSHLNPTNPAHHWPRT